MMQTCYGNVGLTQHARERLDDHEISKGYVTGLIDTAEELDRTGNKIKGEVKQDGVVWRFVIQESPDSRKSDFHLITVIPVSVDKRQAKLSGNWDAGQILNLKIYGKQHEPTIMNDLPNEIKTVKADSRGRVCLGTDYADAQIRVAVVEVVDADE
jgi:hypothetical protein